MEETIIKYNYEIARYRIRSGCEVIAAESSYRRKLHSARVTVEEVRFATIVGPYESERSAAKTETISTYLIRE